MTAVYVLATATIVQYAAVFAALRLMHITKSWHAWSAIAAAITLMAGRRTITLTSWWSGRTPQSPDVWAESTALLISMLMLVGLVLIAPLFRSIRRREERATRLSMALEHAMPGIARLDTDGCLLDVNTIYGEILGHEAKKLKGADWTHAICPEQRGQAQSAFNEMLGSGRAEIELKAGRSDGHHVHIRAVLVRSDDCRSAFEGHYCFIRDITRRKGLEDELGKSERTLQTLLSNLPGMAYRCRNDKAWTMDFVSHGCLALTGYRADDLVSNRRIAYADLIHAADRESVYTAVEHALQGRQPFRLRYRIHTADGNDKWVSEQGCGIYGDDGEVLWLEGFIADISDRMAAELALREAHAVLEKKVKERTVDLARANEELQNEICKRTTIEAELLESEQRLRRAVVESPFPSMIHAEGGEVVLLSKSWIELSGYAHAEIPTITAWVEKAYGERGSEIQAKIAKLYDIDGRVHEGEFVLRTRSGEERVWDFSSAPLGRDRSGRRLVISKAVDITERKRLELERNRFFDLSFDMLGIASLDGYFRRVNPSFERTLGYSAEELMSSPFIELVHPDDRAATLAELGALRAGHPTQHFENRYRCKDGSYKWLAWTSFPVPEEGITFAIARDITEQKRSEVDLANHADALAKANEALVEARRIADASNQAKTEFLATMSHELRTPLNGVIGMTDLLLRTKLDDEQRKRAWMAKSSADALLVLIDDILDFSKIEAGKLELEVIDFDLRYTVENVASMMASRAESKGLELICGVHPGVPRLVRGDPGRLQQVLMNLVGNAIKFTEQGHVFLRVTTDEDSARQATVRFVINDTGIGIKPEQRSRLFQSFSQSDTSTTRKYGGTGLGLAICKRLVEAMNGQIDVESQPGQGSTFWFTVPLEKQAADASTSRQAHAGIRGMRILVVDDNDVNRIVLQEQLEAMGFAMDTAAGGDAALAMLRDAVQSGRPFGVAILDYYMAGMDGRQLARAIRGDALIGDTVLILLTSGLDDADAADLKSLGFAGCATKPVREDQLLEVIVEALTSATSPPFTRVVPKPLVADTPSATETQAKCATKRILVAEDHEISQEVVDGILSGAGYVFDIVATGKQAVEAVLARRYDLILMDCQMPEMDGFEATRRIREQERDGNLPGTGGGRIPILALTANAIQGDRQRCLAAGMDDYVSKPLQSERLLEMIHSHLHRSTESGDADPIPGHGLEGEGNPPEEREHVPGPGSTMPFDVDALRKRWGSHDLAARLMAKFKNRAPEDLRRIEASIAAGNVEALASSAHALKGGAAYLAAERVRELAARLEAMGRAQDLAQAEHVLAELAMEVRRCVEWEPGTMDMQFTNDVGETG